VIEEDLEDWVDDFEAISLSELPLGVEAVGQAGIRRWLVGRLPVILDFRVRYLLPTNETVSVSVSAAAAATTAYDQQDIETLP
jgi:hypothetical protein